MYLHRRQRLEGVTVATAEKMLPQQRRGPRPRPFVPQGTENLRPLATNAMRLAFPRAAKCSAKGVSEDMIGRARRGGEYLAQTLALIDAADMPSAIEAVLLAQIRARAEDVTGTLDALRAADERDAEVEARHRIVVRRAIEALLQGDADDAAIHDAMDVTLEEAALAVDQLARMITMHNAMHAARHNNGRA